MAEVVGLAASIVALAGLAQTVIDFAANLKSFAHDFQTVRTELRRAVDDVDFSARTINTAQRTLHQHCKIRDAEESKVIDFIEDKHVTDYMRGQSRHIKGHVLRLDEKMESLQDSLTFWVTWKWRYSLKEDFEELRVQMQFIQVNFSLLLGTVQLEHAMRREEVDEIYIYFDTYTVGSIHWCDTYSYTLTDAAISAHLKKTVKHYERVIHRLRKHKVLEIDSDVESMSSSTESLVSHEGVKAVLKLARTVRKQEAVPTVNGRDQYVRLRRSSPDRRHGHEERLRAESIKSEGSAQRRTLEEERQRSEQMRADLRRAKAVERQRLFEETIENQRHEQRREEGNRSNRLDDMFPWFTGQPHREGRSSSGSIRLSTPNSFESPNAPRGGSPSRSVAEDEGRGRSSRGSHNEAVYPQSHGSTPARHPLSWQRVLKMKASDSAQRVSGYIGKSDGEHRLVTAILEPEQKFNFMTDKMASDLSLLDSLEPYTGEEEVETWIASVGGRLIMPVGKIEVQWATTQQHRLSINTFSLQFWVFPYHPERPLVLGEPFISKSDYHARRRRSEEL